MITVENVSTFAREDDVLLRSDIFDHPVVGLGKTKRAKGYSNYEAWLRLLFLARTEPAERKHRDAIIHLDVGELIISPNWLAGYCGWTSKDAAVFLRDVHDTELADVRPLVPGGKVHTQAPFILRVRGFAAGKGDPSRAHGNIRMPLSFGARRDASEFDEIAQRVYRRTSVPQPVRKSVYERDGYACVKCGATTRLSVDHIIAVTSGGDNSPENLRTLCLPCNVKKSAKNGEHA